MEQHDRQQGLEKLRELISDIRTAMMTTVDQDGYLHSRPMMTARVEDGNELWFFTSIDSDKVAEIELEQQVNLSYADNRKNDYVSISGRARVERDRRKMEELWSPTNLAWFPQGLDDPGVALIAVKVEHAEYWDSNKMTPVIGLAKALVTGKRYQGAGTEHGKIDL